MRPVAGVVASAALFVLLGGLEWEGSRARWLRDLADGDVQHRIDAVHGLATLDGTEIDDAIAAALADGSADVRIEAAFACEARGLRACAGTLAEWLGSSDPEVRTVAAHALGHVGSDADAAQLARVLGDARPQVRRAAVLGLGALGGAAAARALVTALTDADPIVRERAVTALGQIAGAAGERSAASTALLSLTRDEAPEVRTAALDALGALGDPRTGASAAVALDDDVVEVRLAAMRALTLVPSSVSTAALVNASADEDREGRAALAALARAPGPSALDAIVAALLRQSVARSAEDALETRMRESEAARIEVVDALARALAPSPGSDRPARIAASASRLSLSVSIAGLEAPLLIALRETGAAPVLEALGRTGAEQALVPILDALTSELASTRSAALAGLEGLVSVRVPDGRVLDPLTLAFPRLDESEQARATTLVGLVSGARASDWLVARLDDGTRSCRVAALRALRTRAPASASARLVALIEDGDAEVRSRAALALAGLGEGAGDGVTLQLSDWLVSDGSHDRHAILLALGPLLRTSSESARARARIAILAAFDGQDPELSDSAAWAIAASGDEALARGVLARGEASGPVETARVLRALTGAEGDPARTYGVARLAHADLRVRVAALALLASLGDGAAADAIATRVPSMRFPESATAAFALARMTSRGVVTDAVPGALATLAGSHDPHVRANVAAAAAHLRIATLEGGPAATDWLTPSTSPIVRIAAARWAFATREALDASRVDALLAACATDVAWPSVARACATPALETRTQDADVIAIDALSRPMPDRLVALRLADGSALVTYADARGRVRLADAPAGSLSLDAPESAVLVP